MDRGTSRLYKSDARDVLQLQRPSRGHMHLETQEAKPQGPSSPDADLRGEASAGPAFALHGGRRDHGAERGQRLSVQCETLCTGLGTGWHDQGEGAKGGTKPRP